jgi:hypothetical protein
MTPEAMVQAIERVLNDHDPACTWELMSQTGESVWRGRVPAALSIIAVRRENTNQAGGVALVQWDEIAKLSIDDAAQLIRTRIEGRFP